MDYLSSKIRVIKNSQRLTSERGIGLLELAVILPLILAMVFAGVEFSRALRYQSSIVSVGREITEAAFRDCTRDLYDSSELALLSSGELAALQSEVSDCMSNVLTGSATMVSYPEFKVIFSVFRWNELASPEPDLFAQYKSDNSAVSQLSESDFDGSDPDRRTMLEEQQVVVYTEIYGQYSPIISQVGKIFSFFPGVFYVVSMY